MLQNEMPIPAKIRKNKSSTFSTDLAAAAASKSEQPQKSAPSWLTISMDAALGFRANVFQVTRVLGKLEKILKVSLDSIPSPSVKIQIIGGKVHLR